MIILGMFLFLTSITFIGIVLFYSIRYIRKYMDEVRNKNILKRAQVHEYELIAKYSSGVDYLWMAKYFQSINNIVKDETGYTFFSNTTKPTLYGIASYKLDSGGMVISNKAKDRIVPAQTVHALFRYIVERTEKERSIDWDYITDFITKLALSVDLQPSYKIIKEI